MNVPKFSLSNTRASNYVEVRSLEVYAHSACTASLWLPKVQRYVTRLSSRAGSSDNHLRLRKVRSWENWLFLTYVNMPCSIGSDWPNASQLPLGTLACLRSRSRRFAHTSVSLLLIGIVVWIFAVAEKREMAFTFGKPLNVSLATAKSVRKFLASEDSINLKSFGNLSNSKLIIVLLDICAVVGRTAFDLDIFRFLANSPEIFEQNLNVAVVFVGHNDIPLEMHFWRI